MLTDTYLDLITHGRTSLAGLYLALEESRVTYLAMPEDTDWGDLSRERYIASEEEWYRYSFERACSLGFHHMAFSSIRVPVEPTEAEAYLAAPRYSERIRRD